MSCARGLERLVINTKTVGSRICRGSIRIEQNARIPIAERILGHDYPEILDRIQLQTTAVIKGAGVRGIRGIESRLKRVCERIGAPEQAGVWKQQARRVLLLGNRLELGSISRGI